MTEIEPRKIIIYLAIKYQGDWNAIYFAIKNYTYEKKLDEIEKAYANLTCKAVCILDDEYPNVLLNISKPPFVLFYEGDFSLIKDYKKCLAVVGARNPTTYGKMATDQIVSNLNKDIVVVSGLASGIDGRAHRLAIMNKIRTVAVLGHGLNHCFPYYHDKLLAHMKERELVISEYPPDVPPEAVRFPARNRIIAGLSTATLVTDAQLKSGSMITVSLALIFGRDVLCVPSINFGESGTNKCIKDGAYLVENADDVNFFFRH